MFAVLIVKESVNIEVLGLTQSLELSFIDGMVGAIPVFKDLKSAQAFVGDGKARVLEIEEVNN